MTKTSFLLLYLTLKTGDRLLTKAAEVLAQERVHTDDKRKVQEAVFIVTRGPKAVKQEDRGNTENVETKL